MFTLIFNEDTSDCLIFLDCPFCDNICLFGLNWSRLSFSREIAMSVHETEEALSMKAENNTGSLKRPFY